MGEVPSSSGFWGNPAFPDFWKKELILSGYILEPSSMLGATLQGLFVSRKSTFLEFWDMPDLQKAPFLCFCLTKIIILALHTVSGNGKIIRNN